MEETTAVIQRRRREEGSLHMQKRKYHQHHLHATGKQNSTKTGKGEKLGGGGSGVEGAHNMSDRSHYTGKWLD